MSDQNTNQNGPLGATGATDSDQYCNISNPNYSAPGTITLSPITSGILQNGTTSNSFSAYLTGSPTWSYASSYASVGDDVRVDSRTLKKFMDNVERRLAILEDPSPEKLERHAALRKAYEHYKTIERLIGDE